MSGVPKSRRTKSQVEFFNQAYKLNDAITTLLIRDFGVKKISRDLKTFTYSAKMGEEDRECFLEICNKYNIDVETEYPMWLIEYYRDWILKLLREMINNITQANTVYPTTLTEFEFRRKFQWMAIGNCYQLLQAMQTAIRVLPVKVDKYMIFVEMIKDELNSLKEWKKSDNRIKKAIELKNS